MSPRRIDSQGLQIAVSRVIEGAWTSRQTPFSLFRHAVSLTFICGISLLSRTTRIFMVYIFNYFNDCKYAINNWVELVETVRDYYRVWQHLCGSTNKNNIQIIHIIVEMSDNDN